VRPRARYFGFTTVETGMPPTHLQFLMFSPEQLTELPLPEADMGDELGYINYVVLDNPGVPAEAGSALDEFCTPLTTDTNLHGLTDGEGHLTQDVELGSVPPGAGDFWVVDDPCGDGIDNDGDTRIDELCGFVRVTNPPANSGIYGTGSHLINAYTDSYRHPDAWHAYLRPADGLEQLRLDGPNGHRSGHRAELHRWLLRYRLSLRGP